jgi:hypothetical protein
MSSTPPGTDAATGTAWDAVRQTFLDHLAEEGYRPHFDEGGDIHFKHEGIHFYITTNSDEGYLQVLLPSFWPIESAEELQAAHQAASVVNSTYKVAKFWVRSDGRDMNASAELFVATPQLAMLHLPRCLDVLRGGAHMFREQMLAQSG